MDGLLSGAPCGTVGLHHICPTDGTRTLATSVPRMAHAPSPHLSHGWHTRAGTGGSVAYGTSHPARDERYETREAIELLAVCLVYLPYLSSRTRGSVAYGTPNPGGSVAYRTGVCWAHTRARARAHTHTPLSVQVGCCGVREKRDSVAYGRDGHLSPVPRPRPQDSAL